VRPSLLEILRCPLCHERLEVLERRAQTDAGRLRDGLLGCRACGARYPVLRWIPRLLPAAELTAGEREAAIVTDRPAATRIVEEPHDREAAEREITRLTREKILYTELPPRLRERAERNLDYLLHHTEEKRKFVDTARPHARGTLRVIADLGGGQGGTLKSFREEYRPEISLLVDIDPGWVEVAVLREPENEVVRADGTRLPLADQAIDLLVTTAALEHIADWRGALREMARTSRQTLLCYGPNGSFPYDFGHLDAPLVTWLPPGAGARVARLYHALRRTGRTLESIRQERAVTFYIPRRAAVRELRRQGMQVTNVFGEFLRHTVRESYHLRAAGLKRLLARHGRLRGLFARSLCLLGMEPNVYLFFSARRPRAG
jgi:uncharacterized protein YbaR (Trm112 family)